MRAIDPRDRLITESESSKSPSIANSAAKMTWSGLLGHAAPKDHRMELLAVGLFAVRLSALTFPGGGACAGSGLVRCDVSQHLLIGRANQAAP